MSAWRIAVRALSDLGGSGSTAQVQHLTGRVLLDMQTASRAMARARHMGMVSSSNAKVGGGAVRIWTLTQLGRDYLDGRVRSVATRGRGTARQGGGRRWVATWLASLPQGLRLQA